MGTEVTINDCKLSAYGFKSRNF